jgi:hypothetical protein
MSIPVETVLKLPEMAGVSVVAGAAGLRREISSVDVMEVPDISEYLKPGELLITAMYSIRDNEAMQRRLIPMLNEKGVSALALAPLQEHDTIPGFMIKQADETGLPLLKLPYGISFNDIINIIMNSIIEKRYRSGLIESILQGKIGSLPRVLAMGQTYGWNLEGSFIPVAVQGNINAALPPDVINADLSGGTLLLFPLIRREDAKGRTAEIIAALQADLTVRIGIGRAIENIMELPKGLAQAEQAISIGRQAKWPQCIVCYDNLGIYRVLYSGVDNTEKQLFIHEFLGPILNEGELTATLRIFFENRGNQRSTAKAMNLHYNTVSYRITRIEQLTKQKLDNPDDSLCLQIALKLLDMTDL